jgi:hypothetical protein
LYLEISNVKFDVGGNATGGSIRPGSALDYRGDLISTGVLEEEGASDGGLVDSGLQQLNPGGVQLSGGGAEGGERGDSTQGMLPGAVCQGQQEQGQQHHHPLLPGQLDNTGQQPDGLRWRSKIWEQVWSSFLCLTSHCLHAGY